MGLLQTEGFPKSICFIRQHPNMDVTLLHIFRLSVTDGEESTFLYPAGQSPQRGCSSFALKWKSGDCIYVVP